MRSLEESHSPRTGRKTRLTCETVGVHTSMDFSFITGPLMTNLGSLAGANSSEACKNLKAEQQVRRMSALPLVSESYGR
jgi:hypothetical protein